ncbi:MAG: hypothetical protein HC796_09360 [Synechococcaceae cyanobacterium RL_1_2]|nr:hypothetical protein [Synechococcaceae cyanobacterium RL_1_2]
MDYIKPDFYYEGVPGYFEFHHTPEEITAMIDRMEKYKKPVFIQGTGLILYPGDNSAIAWVKGHA